MSESSFPLHSSARSNRPVKKVYIDEETLAFALNNCHVNIRQMINFLQKCDDLEISETGVEKLVEMIESFKKLKASLEKAEW